jgi:hypothetical protein
MNSLSSHIILASDPGIIGILVLIFILGVLVLPLLPGLIMCIFGLMRWKFDEFFWSSVAVLVLGIGVSIWIYLGGDPFGIFARFGF